MNLASNIVSVGRNRLITWPHSLDQINSGSVKRALEAESLVRVLKQDLLSEKFQSVEPLLLVFFRSSFKSAVLRGVNIHFTRENAS